MTTGRTSVRFHSFPDNCKPKETHSVSSSTCDQEHPSVLGKEQSPLGTFLF